MHQAYPTLFSAWQHKSLTLSQRLIMGSMHTGLEDWLWQHRALSRFYLERAEQGLELLITGGYSPHWRGKLSPWAAGFGGLIRPWLHLQMNRSLKQLGCQAILQLLHAGRYAQHPWLLAPSAGQAPINRFAAKAMSPKDIQQLVRGYVRSSLAAAQAGYLGVEIMGSEGYLLNQFLSPLTNQRQDDYGGSLANRQRLMTEVIAAVRTALGPEFIIVYRLSMLELMANGQALEELLAIGKGAVQAGADLINTGIGWHESRVPTIQSLVPKAAFASISQQFRQQLQVPVIAANRLNDLALAEAVIANGQADLISLARPFLADPAYIRKARQQQKPMPCIGCNQACLDQVFIGQVASCLLNPSAGQEHRPLASARRPKNILVLGGGMAGLAAARYLAETGHRVQLWEQSAHWGGQFQLASLIPGKAEYAQAIAAMQQAALTAGAQLHLERTLTDKPPAWRVDVLVLTTGSQPQSLAIAGMDDPRVLSYSQAITRANELKGRVVIIGGGGIAMDTALRLLAPNEPDSLAHYQRTWQLDFDQSRPGGLLGAQPRWPVRPDISLSLMRRGQGKLAPQLGKTTAWAHRLLLRQHLRLFDGCQPLALTREGLHYQHQGQQLLLGLDHLVLCVGGQSQVPKLSPWAQSLPCFRLGGADRTQGMDAKVAIREAFELARRLAR